MMNLNESQTQAVAHWLGEGLKVSEIQKRLETEFGLRLTYMEVRFLLDDLKLMPKDPEPTKPAGAVGQPAAPTGEPGADTELDEDFPAEPMDEDRPASTAPSRVQITVDRLAHPGALVSGGVTFSDGQTAQWRLDQMGRLGLVPKQQGYRPSAMDVQDFQMALEKELRKTGF